MPIARSKKTESTALKRNKPSGVMMNGKELRTVREVALDNYDAEFMYLRENDLSRFDADVKMDHLRVLDLSINDIGGSVDFLDRTPRLRHLYMTGNKVETLMGISNFATLETLCLSDNTISNFEGLENLPQLRVLSLNFNNISSFEGYPSLPNLHTLNLVGNPITGVPSYRSMAIAINCPDLVSVDGNPVLEEERAAVSHYHGKIVYCIREGFIVEGTNVNESADQFLLKRQRECEVSKCLQLCAIRLNPEEEGSLVVMEGQTITLSLCMQDIRPYSERTAEVFHSSYLYPVIFKVSGEATEVFVIGSMNNWTDPIELERCEEDGAIFFHTTLYLPAGDYEYRYIVDGDEKVSDVDRITSKFNQGFCNLYAVFKQEQDDEDADTILHIRWMRSNAQGIFTVIEDQNELTYVPVVGDIDGCIRAEVLAYMRGEFSFMYFDITSPVLPAPPSCPRLEIKGEAAEGSTLLAEADYTGGIEGSSSLTWFRVLSTGDAIPIEQRDPWAGYKITGEDVGCRIRAQFTPVRNDWVPGDPKSVDSDVVTAGEPECESIKIIGNLLEGSELEVDVHYVGGEEGDSFYQWLRRVDNADEYVPIGGQNSTKYTTTLDDVGKCLAVEYTPVSAEGKEGETCRCVLENPIEAKQPEVRNLNVTGQMEEGHVLTLEYEYTGGHFGAHNIQWFRKASQRGRPVKIGQPNSAFLKLTPEDVDCIIEVSMTPVRSDGARGRVMYATADGVVASSHPAVRSVTVVGEPYVGYELSLMVQYVGGTEGPSEITWEVEDPETKTLETIATDVTSYVVGSEDEGKTIKVTYIPVREDGLRGEPKSHTVEIQSGRPPTPPAAAVQELEVEEAPEEVQEEPVQEEAPEEAQEEAVQEEAAEEIHEEPVQEEAPEEAQEEPAQEEAAEEAQAEPVQEEAAEEAQEEAVEEAQEEPAQEQAAEEAVEETHEEAAPEEAEAEEPQPADEPAPEPAPEPAAEEAAEPEAEEAAEPEAEKAPAPQ
ncbi:leucine-rich repeat protein [Strigomonas culicis]|uniref:Leucine-rich repeat protein n=1 Tax=Strigomonas culicis TaxID=28005 RepID=S9TZU4_9TRYP|nr:leucine-rich repeat protein [Strigomonas culicis]|eukprot:EPY22168.1 leucine-rich repeat protein [Strigomonas culicis]